MCYGTFNSNINRKNEKTFKTNFKLVCYAADEMNKLVLRSKFLEKETNHTDIFTIIFLSAEEANLQ